MHLLQNLLSGGFRVRTETRETENPASGKFLPRYSLTTILSSPDGKEVEKSISVYCDFELEKILHQLCATHFPDAAPYLAWKKENGHVPVRLVKGVFGSLAELLHTSLRKNSDTDASCVLWNAIGNLADADLAALWEACEKSLKTSFAGDVRPTRHQAAREFADAVKLAVRKMLYRMSCRDSTHNDTERFALKMLYSGVQMSTSEEWAYGWLGFALEPLPLREKRPRPVKKGGPKRGAAVVKKLSASQKRIPEGVEPRRA